MSDYERYGDYDEIEDDIPPSKSPVMLILKIITAALCLGVIGLLSFRMILFNRYPADIKDFYINDEFFAYYNDKGEIPKIKTQSLRSPYDDPDLGNFFCDYLYVVEELGQLQVAVRYNVSTVERIAEEKKISLSADDENCFSYRLCINYSDGKEGSTSNLVYIDEVSDEVFDESVMYRYKKLVFDGIEFVPDKNGDYPVWMRLEVIVDGEVYSMVPIYENHSEYSRFAEYEISRQEVLNGR